MNSDKYRGAGQPQPKEPSHHTSQTPPLVHNRQLLRHFPDLGYVPYDEWIGLEYAGGYDSWHRREI